MVRETDPMRRTAGYLCLAALLATGLAPGGCKKTLPRPDAPPPRIVSFSPALTDLLFGMGLGDHVVGVTSFCDLPAGEERLVCGSRQSIEHEKLLHVRPDVILIQQDPKTFDSVRRSLPEAKIEHFDIHVLADIAKAMERIGRLVGNEKLGREHSRQFRRRLDAATKRVAGLRRPKVLFVNGTNPLTVSGKESFIHEMVELAGGEDLGGRYERWTRINVERVLQDRPEVIVCQVDPADAEASRRYLMSLTPVPAVQNGRVFVVTDRHWTIPSARMADLTNRLAEIIHPELAPREGGGT